MTKEWLETQRAQCLYIITNARHKPSVEAAAKELVELDKKLAELKIEVVKGATL